MLQDGPVLYSPFSTSSHLVTPKRGALYEVELGSTNPCRDLLLPIHSTYAQKVLILRTDLEQS